MSMIGELTFFLGLQVKQLENGMFISQTKYALNLVKRFSLENSKEARTPLSTTIKLAKDTSSKQVDAKLYKSMIGSLLYLTASRPDIMFSVGLCARFQADPRETHLNAVKRKNTSGSCFFVGKNLVSWFSKKQNSISLSNADVEYIVTGSCCTDYFG
ncbi:uncharacterized protein LOC116015718 [Ipomoea triloba]|uniref:uncharacterized protein LOC116015718 n=1 Tax=Ipomoea triloba TaxID=35885 RepID=UPI00125D0978|nr:uncharacterized protein LOC116015718 [Ipomoea triloba]